MKKHKSTIATRLIANTFRHKWYSKYELSILGNCKRSSISYALSQLRAMGKTVLMK